MTARAVGIPFRRVAPHHVVAEHWQSYAGGNAGPLSAELLHWDYNEDLRLVRSLIVREADIRTACRLAPNDELRAVVVWRSSGNNVRGRGSVVSLGNANEPREFTLSAEVRGQMLAEDVQISTQIVLANTSHSDNVLAARYPGSVLWEDSVGVALEGSGSRFPMEVVDFNEVFWAPYNAGWFLAWNSEELHTRFLRNVRLFINGSHPDVVAAVQTAAPTRDHALIRSAIYCDVGRQLIRGALLNDEFVESPDAFADGSTGKAILGMLRTFFSAYKVRALRDMMITRKEHFDGMIQGALRVFRFDP